MASLHLASTPLIALACAGAARAHPGRARLLLLGDFEYADRLAGLLRRWRDNPFESIDCLPGRFDEHARGAPDRARGLAQFFRRVAIKRALRRDTLARIAAHDAAVLPTRVWLGNDRKVETQFALQCAAKRAQGKPGEYLDDGLYTYLGDVRQRPLTRALDALVKQLTYGAWWQRAAQVGTTSWIANAWLALPTQAPPAYSCERVRTLPREWFAGRAWLRLAALATREFGVDRGALRHCTHVWVLPHSNLLRASPALLDALRERLRTASARNERIALKYHPREVEPDPGALIAHGAAMILPATVPMELLLPLLPRGARIEGEASTALLAARWLRTDLDVRTFGTASHPYALAAERLLRTLA
ncbi:MAG: hypothetical protein ABIP49_07300 [Lysobacterales bacterium]